MEETAADRKDSFAAAEETISSIAVTARIPEFWQDQPRLWFIQAEAVLQTQRTSEDAKYHLVIAKLGKEVITQVTDILVSPPATGKYETLKSRLLAIYEETQGRQIQKLIGEMELGDQKPSQLLRRMRDLARDKVSDETLTILWRNHLPTTVRGVLAVSDTKDLNTLATIADKVMETTKPLNAVSQVDQRALLTAEKQPQTTGEINELVEEIRSLNARISRMENDRGRSRSRFQSNQHRNRSMSRGRSNSVNRRTPESPNWLCSYHFRYKHRAYKCVEPCNWRKRSDVQQSNVQQQSSSPKRFNETEN